jgi:hypothetical protein
VDDDCFDAMTRVVAGGSQTRRAALRLLAGAGLGLLAARLGLSEDAEAKKTKRTRRSEATPQGRLRAESKRKGKKPGRKKPKPRPPCGPDRWQCADGSCVAKDQCCAGEKRCPDGSCRSEDQCCNDQKRCNDGSCVALDTCCADEWPCGDGSCISPDQCCPDEKRCGIGDCIPRNQCCPGERRCGDGSCTPFYICCPDEKECGLGDDIDCIPEDECCDFDAPLCSGCQEPACIAGEWTCRETCACRGFPDECRPGMEQDPETCICGCPADSISCGYFCCPADTTCLGGEGFRTWCLSDGGATQCPIGWTPYRDSGLCYPGALLSGLDAPGDDAERRDAASARTTTNQRRLSATHDRTSRGGQSVREQRRAAGKPRRDP